MFTERKIEKFQQTISALPDTPNLSAAELKRRFDACPEELRTALNGVCDDGKALEKRMDAYRAETFEGEITRDMLAPAVREELSGKAEQTALAAETAARENADTELQTAVAKRYETYFGTYTGDGKSSHTITLEFPIQVILIFNETGLSGWYDSGFQCYSGGLAAPDHPSAGIRVTGNSFTVSGTVDSRSYKINNKGTKYYFLALH